MHRADTTKGRRTQRRRVLKGARISCHGLSTSTESTIRNISETGACLVVASPIGLPNDFDLVIDSDRAIKRCRVAWRAGTKIGVSFEAA